MWRPEQLPDTFRLHALAWISAHLLFLVTVAVPTLLAAIYFGLIAADIYVSESRFVIRSPERQMTSPLGLLFKGSGLSGSAEDSFTVRDFMLSRDAMRGLQKSIDLRGAFGRGDILRGFPGLDWDDSEENLHRYYQGMVEAQVDSMSPIVVLTVRAFTAVDALGINERLLEQGEALVNQLNERARLDMIRFAQDEADIAETRAKRAAIALAQFRNERGVIDPERQTTISFQQIAKLQEELIAARTQLTQLLVMARDNPQVSPLIKRVQSLEDEITRESARVTGGGKSLASKASEFQRLALEKEFAEKQLTVALASLEQARNEAHRKQLYLERIAQPNLPDVAMEPKRLRAFFATMVMALITWGVVSMVVAGVKEHAN